MEDRRALASNPSRGSRNLVALAVLLGLLGLAVIGYAQLVATPAHAASPEATVADGRLFKVLEPHDDALMRGNQLRVKLLLRDNVSLRSARLNGKSVKRFFSSRRSGSREVATLRKSTLDGLLPRGRNFLRFIVRRGGSGGKKDYEAVAFTRVRLTPDLVRRFKLKYNRTRGAKVTLVPSTLAAQIRVQLNGKNVSKQFRAGTPLKQAARLGASDGLKHGRNRLKIRTHTHNGELVKLRRNFRVGRLPTIAGAGPDRRVAAGLTARLNGKASKKALRKSGKPKEGALRYRWKLTKSPKGSDAQLAGRSKKRPSILTDLPGTYTAKLRTTQAPAGSASAAGTTSSRAVTKVTADAQPLVATSTFATVGGRSGISVEVTRECADAATAKKTGPPCFYPHPGADDELQVVVLDRATLEKKSNTAYDTDSAGLTDFKTAMQKFVFPQEGKKCPVAYDTDKLVLIALRAGTIPSGGIRSAPIPMLLASLTSAGTAKRTRRSGPRPPRSRSSPSRERWRGRRGTTSASRSPPPTGRPAPKEASTAS